MRLLRRPPSDLIDARQIKQFAQSNRIILELTKQYSAEELIEIAKYRDFFGDMERAARSVINGVEGAEIHLQKLEDKLSTMIGEAEGERDRTGNEDMRSLYDYFINHYDCLTKMVLIMVSEHQEKHKVVKETNIQMGDQNRSSYEVRKHNDLKSNIQSHPAKINKSQCKGATTEDEISQEALNNERETSRKYNATEKVAGGRMAFEVADDEMAFEVAGGGMAIEVGGGGMANEVADDEMATEVVQNVSSSESHFGDGHVETVGTTRNDPGAFRLRTLEDSLKHFGLVPRLWTVEQSLEEMRKGNKTKDEHEADCKSLDEVLEKLSRNHYPDSVMRRGGSEEEVKRAKALQTALNATQTVLHTLKNVFLQDIHIEHKYRSFNKLDFGILGDEDEVQCEVYRVLFKVNLVSDIHQESIVGIIRRFLEAARLCVDSYLTRDFADFRKHRDSAFLYLERCVAGYSALRDELEAMRLECERDHLRNILPLIRRMKEDCSEQLKRVKGLFDLTKRPFGEPFPMYEYSPRDPMDFYFVPPFFFYVYFIMACSIMIKGVGDKDTFLERISRMVSLPYMQFLFPSQVSDELYDPIFCLCKVAWYYAGHKQYISSVEELAGHKRVSKEQVKELFRVRLGALHDASKSLFQTDDYVGKGKKDIVKDLVLCREMKSDLEKEKAAKADTEEVCAETVPKEEVTEAKIEKVLPKDTSNVNPELGSTSSASASDSNCTATHRSDAEGKRDENSPGDRSKPNLETIRDCLIYFGLDGRYQQLVEFAEEVNRGTRTAEEYEAECKRFDKQLQKLLHTHHPDFVTLRGGSEEELAQARELLEALNNTRRVLNGLNRELLEEFDFKKKKVPVHFTEAEEVKRALDFAHLRKMDMETRLEGGASGEERKATEAYWDFYSLMKRVMGAVLDGEQGANRQVTELYDLYNLLLFQSKFSKAVHVSYYTHIRLHPHKQFQEDENELARMFTLAHYMALKQDHARIKGVLDNVLKVLKK